MVSFPSHFSKIYKQTLFFILVILKQVSDLKVNLISSLFSKSDLEVLKFSHLKELDLVSIFILVYAKNFHKFCKLEIVFLLYICEF